MAFHSVELPLKLVYREMPSYRPRGMNPMLTQEPQSDPAKFIDIDHHVKVEVVKGIKARWRNARAANGQNIEKNLNNRR